ncbi:MAG: dTDP-4-dehydrorhamnose reductase [Lentisphaerae bacterium]|nr:dTDP-4-dehydrorhamnose reductase [Lentisphaerota bacterium]MBQ4329093.1 dTDP-4-dehydrorhamnose reductase [Lentisphaeria bacterium]
MKVLITGGKGMLGRTLCAELKEFELIPTDLPEADITDAAKFNALIAEYAPDAVIHCAAMTAVDKCETEIDFAYKLNALGSANVASACHRNGVRLIAISTDYVFDGDSDRPYNEFDRASGGNTVYGKSKFAGEEAIRRHCPDHVICRISWLYGAGGPSFVHAMMNLADGTRPELKVVADQIGNPTSTLAVAQKLREILNNRELVGTFHMTCEGEASWADFAAEIFRLAGKDQKIVPCTTAEFPRPAPRPANSRLDKMMLRLAGISPMPHWKDALAAFMKSEF